MVDAIKRNLTPGVGQNQLQKWLKSTQVNDPVVNQNPDLQVCQELQPFQQRYRLHQDSQQLAGAETTIVFDVTVPEDEAWRVDYLWIEHNNAGDIDWTVNINRAALMDRASIVARLPIRPGVMSPMIGNAAIDPTGDVRFSSPTASHLIWLPGDLVTVTNTLAMTQPNLGRIQVRYRLAPLPIEILAATGWSRTTN